MDYESAAVYRDKLQAIDAVLNKSALVLTEDTDADLFGIAEDELAAAVQHFVIRGGRVRGVRATTIEKELDITGADLVDQVLQRTYGGAAEADIPKQVLVPVLPDDAAELEEWLRARRGRNVSIQVAQRGRKADLMKTASLNAQQALMLHKTRRTSDYVARTQALTDLQEALDLAEAPLRIECFDVSHLSGTNVVASMVVFEDGLPRKDQYRSFKVEDTTDDTDSLYQVLTRRLAYVDRGEDAVPEAEAVRGGVAGSGADAARSAEDTGAGE
jgi:excinuclease ABC subunit C